MKIIAIEAIPFRLPVRQQFRWTGLHVSLGGFVLVRVMTDEGLVGIGEATPLPDWGGDFGAHGGETQQTVVEVVHNHLGPAIEGLDPTQIARVVHRMDQVVRGHTYAKCAVDIAIHDLAAQAASVPLYQYLGGAYRDRVAIAHMVGLMDTDAAIEEATKSVHEHSTALQIKGGESIGRDVALVSQIRDAVGPDVVLRVDANQGYGSVKAASRAVTRLADAGADMIEQPVEGLNEMALVTASVPIPTIADETCWSPHDALQVVINRAADVISIYLAKAGGLWHARNVAAIAATANLPCDVNGSIESGIGTAANLHFALATPAISLPSVIPINAPEGSHRYEVAGHYYTDDVIVQALPTEPGHLLPTSAPGLGIELDEDKLERYRVDRD